MSGPRSLFVRQFPVLAVLVAVLAWSPAFAGVTIGSTEEDRPRAFAQLVRRSGGRAASAPRLGAGKEPVAKVTSAGGSGRVMLQGFHWESHMTYPWWGVVSAMAANIAHSGFDFVWLPPSSAAISDEGYLPNRLYVQDSNYGTADELREAVAALRSGGVGALADIVINHRVGTNDWADFTEPYWGPEAVCSDDEWPGARGGRDSGKGYHAARDVDHSNAGVRESILEWMRWLKDSIGYAGWRYDYVRGYAPRYWSYYNDSTAPEFSVVEIWDDLDLNNTDAHRQQLCDWLDAAGGQGSAFDFTTKAILQQAVRQGEYWRLRDADGKPSGLIGWWPARAVTFLDNHDTGPSTGGGGQNHWPFPGEGIMQGYAYILTHPGVPCVYWTHFFDWGIHDSIRDLIWIRKSAGITAESAVDIRAADSSRYAAVIDGKVAMKIGWGDWSPGGGWDLAAYGRNYAVWVAASPSS